MVPLTPTEEAKWTLPAATASVANSYSLMPTVPRNENGPQFLTVEAMRAFRRGGSDDRLRLEFRARGDSCREEWPLLIMEQVDMCLKEFLSPVRLHALYGDPDVHDDNDYHTFAEIFGCPQILRMFHLLDAIGPRREVRTAAARRSVRHILRTYAYEFRRGGVCGDDDFYLVIALQQYFTATMEDHEYLLDAVLDGMQTHKHQIPQYISFMGALLDLEHYLSLQTALDVLRKTHNLCDSDTVDQIIDCVRYTLQAIAEQTATSS